jgi:iron only hydrogenase large subunit-like protein
MNHVVPTPLVSTIKERCRVCYTCVRECPAKAIRISAGQAEVIPERCIGCGNCVRVCSQQAKQVKSSIAEVEQLLAAGHPVAACLAPSFPAEFTNLDYPQLVGMVRALCFDLVQEVAFGADLVAERYRALLAHSKGQRWIATNCPAIVESIGHYHPALAGALAPVVSPSLATARVLRRLHGDNLRVVLIGPGIAKQTEQTGRPGAGSTFTVLLYPGASP